jgi:hypothetical protein
MVTATIFCIVALGIASSFISGVKLWGRAKARSFYYNNVILNMEMIFKELRQSVDLPQIGFEGNVHEISFPVVSDNIIFKVTYKFDSEKKILLRRLVALKDIISGKEKENFTEKIFLNLDDFSLDYFYFDKENNKYVWKDEWTKDKGIFTAVRLKTKFKDEDFIKTIFITIS